MLDEIEVQNLNKEWSAIRLFWVVLYAVLVACLILANLADSLGQTDSTLNSENTSNTESILRYTIYGISLVVFGISYRIRRFMLRTEKTKFDHYLKWIPLYNSIRERRHGAAQMALARYIACTMFFGVLLATIGTFGLVLYLANDDVFSLYVLAGISAGLLFLLRPRKQSLVALVVEAKRSES